MSPTLALFRNETRLLARNPGIVIWTVAIPVIAIIVMTIVPGARRPIDAFGGLSITAAYQPTLVVFATSMMALQMMPMLLGQYREMGFLRRLRTTPASPGQLLVAILVLTALICLVVSAVIAFLPLLGGVGTIGRAAAMLGWAAPITGSFLALGAMLAAIIPNPRIASGAGAALSAVMWFFAGMWMPRASFPDWLAAIGRWTPGGAAADAIDALTAGTMAWQPLLCLVAWTLLGVAIAARTFKWE